MKDISEQLALYEEESTPPPITAVRGKHDPRNQLNDLTGAEWVYFLNSVEATLYPTSGKESYAHKIRRIHPSPKPPQLMSRLIQFFTKKDGWVLDPFMGVGGTLLGCSLCDRNGVGIDLEQKYIDAYQKVCTVTKLTPQTTLHGDSYRLETLLSSLENAPPHFDLILTDPPYSDMMARVRTGQKQKQTGKSEATPFTTLENDLGNMSRENFLKAFREIMEKATLLLKPKGYCVVFCKDIQPTAEHHNMLHVDIVEALNGVEGLQFRGYKIWYDKTPALYPFGYPFAFVSNQLHQFILIFRKEPPRKRRTVKE